MRLIGVGFFIGGSIVLGTFSGLWLDDKFNTKPLFMIVGLFIGLVVAGYGVYQMLRPLLGNNNDKENN